MESSSWPTWTFCPSCALRCANHAIDGRNDFGVAQIQLRLVERGLGLGGLRLSCAGTRLGHGDLLGSDLGIGERGLSLAKAGPGLLHDFLGGADAGRGSGDGGIGRSSRGNGLIVLLLGDLLLCHKSFVTRPIGVGCLGIGLGLDQPRLGFFDLLDGSRDSGFGIEHIGLRGMNLAAGAHLRDRHIELRRLR